MQRHFTATTFIVFQGKVLLHFHKKLKKWLAVGGHIEENELPEAAALREVKEETGLDVELYDANHAKQMKSEEARTLIQPMYILQAIVGLNHEHLDLNYFAKAESFDLNPLEGETTDLRWFTAEELKTDDIPVLIRKMSLEALELLK